MTTHASRSTLVTTAALALLAMMSCGTLNAATRAARPSNPHAKRTSYYVSPAGSDSANGLSPSTPFKTPQHAADITKPGDTVYLMTGTYTNGSSTGAVLQVSRAGTASSPITYTALAGNSPVISFNGWAGILVKPTAAYIVIKGLTILGNNDNVTLADAQKYELSPSSHPELNGNCVSIDGRHPTTSARPNHIQILNNVVGKCGGGGIVSIEADYLTISGNTVFDSAWYSAYGTSAISMLNDWNSDSSTGYKMIVTGNRLYDNEEYIPWIVQGKVTDGEGIIVDTNNNASTADGSKLTPYKGRTLIANNVIADDGSDAVEVFQSAHVDVVNNSTYGDVRNPAESGRGEMNMNRASDVNVVNNIFYATKGQNPLTVGTCTRCHVSYNLYYNGTNSPATMYGPHDMTADPLYKQPAPADPSKFDLSVRAASPAIDSGTSYLAPSTDINGTPRPQGHGYDRGAYER